METETPTSSARKASAPNDVPPPPPPPPPPSTKTETFEKRETRSRHEKKRREEMNGVLSEMMSLLPDGVQRDASKLRRVDQKPKKPDKCFIIGNAVEFIRKSMKKPVLLADPLAQDMFGLTNCFLVNLNNFVIVEIEGDHRKIFDLEKNRMIGKDIRCFLDFESANKLSFLTLTHPLLNLRSFMAKSMTCRVKHTTPAELTLVCIPDATQPAMPMPIIPSPIVRPVAPPSPPPSKKEAEGPLLAALLRRKDPPQAEFTRERERILEEKARKAEEERRRQRDRHVSMCMAHNGPITSIQSDAAPTSSFPLPASCSTASCHLSTGAAHRAALNSKRPSASSAPSRKRLRSINALVESFPLSDDVEDPAKRARATEETNNFVPTTTTTTTTTTLATVMSTPTLMTSATFPIAFSTPPVTIPTTTFIAPIPSTAYLNVNPFDVLTHGYRDIWLRLQSERLLLETKIVRKEGELKTLLLTNRALMQPSTMIQIPQYTLPQATLDMLTAQNVPIQPIHPQINQTVV